jgi:flagellar basal-body rod modification protein FlgD
MATSGAGGVGASIGPNSSTAGGVKVSDLTNPYEQKEMFLKLLVAQLKNQDPTSPMDQKEMLGQMAQFTTVEQLTNLAKTMQGMSFTGTVQLIGKTVDYTSTNVAGEAVPVTGVTVTGISSGTDGKTFLELSDGAKVEPSKLTAVR